MVVAKHRPNAILALKLAVLHIHVILPKDDISSASNVIVHEE